MKVDPQLKSKRAHWRNCVALGCLVALPSLAQAQSYSPGGLVTTAPPALTNGPASGGVFGAAPQFPRGGAGGQVAANPPDFQWTAFGGLRGRYTSNAEGSATGSSDFDLRGEFGVSATENSARVNAMLNYSGSLDYFARNSSDVIFTNNLNANAVVEILQDHLFLSAGAFAAPVYSSQLGNIAPAGETLPPGSNSDLRNTYGFDVSPDLTFRLGNFLRSDSMPAYTAAFIDSPAGAGASPLAGIASSITTKAFTQRLSTGDYFSRLQLLAVGNYVEMGKSSGGLTQRAGIGEVAYAVNHDITVIGDGGYHTVTADVPLNRLLSGPVLQGGLRFDTPYLTGEFRVGEQYHSLSVVGHLTLMIDPTLTLSGNATDDVTTPGGSLLSPSALLAGVISGIAAGQIQIPASGFLSLDNVALAGIGLQNTPARIKTQSVSLQYNGLERLTALISAILTTQSDLAGGVPGQNLNLQEFSITPSLNYAISDDLNAGLDFRYSDEKLAFGHSNVDEFRAHTEYRLSDRTQIYLEGDYLQRNSNAALSAVSANSGSVSATSLTLGIRRQF